jgi:hypothetical protein
LKSTLLFVLFLGIGTFAQVKTVETRSTKDSTGKVVVTQSEIISKSEDITPRNFMITINPLKFLLFYNISFYMKVEKAIAIGIGIQTPTISGLSGFGFNGEMRLYPKAKSLRGFYVAPNFSVNSLKDNYSTKLTVTSLGVLLGWQWFPGDDFSMGLGIGIDHYFGSDNSGFSSVEGNAPALRFDIGFAW